MGGGDQALWGEGRLGPCLAASRAVGGRQAVDPDYKCNFCYPRDRLRERRGKGGGRVGGKQEEWTD